MKEATEPGGLLRYGIPNMKLEKSVVDRRIHLMEEEGVKFVSEYQCRKRYHSRRTS